MHSTKVNGDMMIRQHRKGKQIIQTGGERRLSSVATFYLGDRYLVPPSSHVGVTALYGKM